MERTVVHRFLYPALLSPPPTLSFNDQFAFRPTGSTTAALISILSTITNMLLTNPYVIAFDFSKAFDTVRHSTLLAKMAQLDIPDNVYNWMADFFSGHSHCTTYRGQASTMQSITASIIQGSGIGPASYVVNAGDLKALTSGNHLCKFADDTYLIVPSGNEGSRLAEIDSIETWAKRNNLMLNRKKTKEIVFVDTKRKRHFETPPLLPEIDRMTSLKILGVTMTDCLSASDHVCDIITRCAQTLRIASLARPWHGRSGPADCLPVSCRRQGDVRI
jgi:hypothetical protein